MDMMPEYKQVKKYCDLIGTINILQSICYANKDGGTIFKPYKKIKFRKKHLNYTMNKHKLACTCNEDAETNFKSSLLVGGCFLFGSCSLKRMLGESNLKWKNYLTMSKEDCTKWEKKANELDKSMIFVLVCRSNKMQKDLKCMSTYNQKQYLQDIKAASHIY